MRENLKHIGTTLATLAVLTIATFYAVARWLYNISL